ncbi:hypothetical protein DITRI_Ditri08aG0135700 [Diplodiscus trichospermus]
MWYHGEAKKLFDEMKVRDVLAWNTLVSGYAQWGDMESASDLFDRIPEKNPCSFTCTCLKIGTRIFDLTDSKHDPVLWKTMISALAQHGHGEEAVKTFDDVVKQGVKPNRATFVVVLNTCSHSGLVQEGLKYFECISSDHRIIPDQQHYACLIDLLGRAGCFDQLINHWRRCHSSAASVLLSSIYGALGKWESVEKVRHLMNKREVRKESSLSWIELENKVHAFTVSNSLHPLKGAIYSVLDQLAGQMDEDASLIEFESKS